MPDLRRLRVWQVREAVLRSVRWSGLPRLWRVRRMRDMHSEVSAVRDPDLPPLRTTSDAAGADIAPSRGRRSADEDGSVGIAGAVPQYALATSTDLESAFDSESDSDGSESAEP